MYLVSLTNMGIFVEFDQYHKFIIIEIKTEISTEQQIIFTSKHHRHLYAYDKPTPIT